jgi:hypothetical protein
VELKGARGLPPTAQYKVSATHPDGFRCTASCLLGRYRCGEAKGQRVSQAIINKTEEMFAERGWGAYKEVSIELLGSEATYGSRGQRADTREVVVKIAVRHAKKRSADPLLPRDRSGRHRHGTGPDRHRRRSPDGVSR